MLRGEMLAKFEEQAERCVRLKSSSSWVCDLILGLADDWVLLTICIEEAAERLQVMQEEHQEAVIKLKALRSSAARVWDWCWEGLTKFIP
jgi:hypothetical protein